ncbi:Holliday junction resolvase RuvX [Akkermansiaceae bacterium]|nr:Holliday junction resolvase RuvX [Akkermansiaceae bacterium]
MSLPHPILAIDYGEARVGLAMTDASGILPHPLETVENNDAMMEVINAIIAKHQIQSLLIGHPLRLDGSEGTSAIKVRKFKKLLQASLTHQLPIDLMDERHSTVEASKKLHQAGKNNRKQKSIIDQAAAVEILNNYLEKLDNPFGLLSDPFQD